LPLLLFFSIPLAYQSIEAFVPSDEHRFDNNIDRINNEDVSVMVIDADTSDFLTREDFPKAKRLSLGQLNGTDSDLYMSLATKKADVIFDTVGLWRQYDKANPGKVRRAAAGHNLRVFGLSVVTNNDDPRLLELINVGVQEIVNSGAVDRILKKNEALYPDMYLKSIKPYAE
jgi:ABC-type amino acid transport substrate-binding protein